MKIKTLEDYTHLKSEEFLDFFKKETKKMGIFHLIMYRRKLNKFDSLNRKEKEKIVSIVEDPDYSSSHPMEYIL